MADSTRAAFWVANSVRVALDSRKWQYSSVCRGVSLQHTISTTCKGGEGQGREGWAAQTRAAKAS